ncbi:MAG: hypothetical protein J6V36_04670 [Clostridia bacterium]|nr:hypothetical protein [Clostridia bacterium]
MYKVIIEIKKDISDETLYELTTIINNAFDNRGGKVVGTKTNSPYCFEFSGDEDKYECLDSSADILKEYKLFWDNVIVWKWEEDEESECHDLMGRKNNVFFEINVEELKIYHPDENWEKGYDDIREFMEKYGFELYTVCEPSDYSKEYLFKSKKYLFESQVDEILVKLTEEHPWTHKCVEKCNVWESSWEKSLMGILFPRKTEDDSDE